MPTFRFFVLVMVTLAAAGCARQQQTYVVDPATGLSTPAMWRQPVAPMQYAQFDRQPRVAASNERGLFDWRQRTVQPQYAQQTYASQAYTPPPAPRPYLQPQAYVPTPTPYPYVAPNDAPQYARAQNSTLKPVAPDSFASASLY